MTGEDIIKKDFEKMLKKKYKQDSFVMSYHILRIKFVLAGRYSLDCYFLNELDIRNTKYKSIGLFKGKEDPVSNVLSEWQYEYGLDDKKYAALASRTKKSAARILKKSGYIPPDKIYLSILDKELKGWLDPDRIVAQRESHIIESDIEKSVIRNIHNFEPGFHIISRQYQIQDGFIDILGKDAAGTVCIMEIKNNGKDERVVFQSIYYQMEIKRFMAIDKVRMIVIGNTFSDPILKVLSSIENVEIYKYSINTGIFGPYQPLKKSAINI